MLDSNRLKNLFRLLECKNSAVRRQTIQNLGTILASHPDEFGNLLWHILFHLEKPLWETRVAAAESISVILTGAKKIHCPQLNNLGFTQISVTQNSVTDLKSTLRDFNLESTLRFNSIRLGFMDRKSSSAGRDTNREEAGPEQRKRIDQKLGLHPQLGLDSRNWYSDEDLAIHKSHHFIAPLRSAEETEAREKIRQGCMEKLRDSSWELCGSVEQLIEVLLLDLSSFLWESRHGAALGLKHCVLKAQDYFTHKTLETVSSELLATLALDRFNDFVEAQAVAPVRETCAQVLAFLIGRRTETSTFQTIIEKLSDFFGVVDIWECKQSALLVLKYLLPIVPDELCSRILTTFQTDIFNSLAEENDEIAAAGAQALLPIAGKARELWGGESLLRYGWNLLIRWSQNDEASISGVLRLLLEWLDEECGFVPTNDELLVLLSLVDHSSQRIRGLGFRVLRIVMNQHSGSVLPWPEVSVQMIFRVLYRRVLLEPSSESGKKKENHDIVEAWADMLDVIGQERIATLICPYVGVWMACLMVPDTNPNLNSFVALDVEVECPVPVFSQPHDQEQSSKLTNRDFIGGIEVMALDERSRTDLVIENKLVAAKILGITFKRVAGLDVPCFPDVSESPVDSLNLLIQLHISSTSALQRSAAAMTLLEWANYSSEVKPSKETLDMLKVALLEPPAVFDETGLKLTELNTDCTEFFRVLEPYGLQIKIPNPTLGVTPDGALGMCRSALDSVKSRLPAAQVRDMEERLTQLSAWVPSISKEIQAIQGKLNVWLACAVLAWKAPLDKWNPVVKPLMDSVKMEENIHLSGLAAQGLSMLTEQALTRKPCPNPKIIKNLVSFHCSNAAMTPGFEDMEEKKNCILSLDRLRGSGQLIVGGSVDASDVVMGRNAGKAIQAITESFDLQLKNSVPVLWSMLYDLDCKSCGQDTVNQLQVLETAIPVCSQTLTRTLLERHRDSLWSGLTNANPAVRHLSSRCITRFSEFSVKEVADLFFINCLQNVHCLENVSCRAGIIELFFNMSEVLGERMVGFLSLISPAVLGRMSDTEESIRSLSSVIFSKVVSLMPLESGVKMPRLCDELEVIRQKNYEFLTLLTNPSGLQTLELPLEIKEVTLRPYQREGVTWLWFLNQYSLHGILCDDMGLGKTIQTLCVMAFSHHEKRPKFPSLIVCPRTLIAHWVSEINRFFDPSTSPLKAVSVENSASKVIEWNKTLSQYSVVVTSYDTVRRYVSSFSERLWHYCVLDEGHLIRNAKTQLFKAVTMLKAEHRLILSGTPIQNTVLELWTLFQFLMPGYLGSQQSFNARYVKPVLQSRDAKMSSDQDESPGERALETLHKQVLPFVLRRQKTDVLKDLPPKIIQDYSCELSSLQKRLYEEFGRKIADHGIGRNDGNKDGRLNPLMVLTYLRKLCDHPCLVLNPSHPGFDEIRAEAKENGSDVTNIDLSGKMAALRELLEECGIGDTSGPEENSLGDHGRCVVSQHRALIFCQFKSTVELIENYLKGITLKLDEQFVKHQVSEFSMEWNLNVELSSACGCALERATTCT